MTVFYHSLNIKASKFCDMQHNISFVDKKIKNKYNIFQNFRKVYKTYSLTLHFVL